MGELRVRSVNSTLQKVAKKPLAGSLRSQPGNTWVTDLPLIICGPILRKVYYDHVSVWLAFKEEVSDITLNVFDTKNTSNIILSGIGQSPLMLGKNLFITLVTAVSSGKKLSAENIYGYDISFRHSSRVMSLKDAAVLKGGIQSVAYRPFNFPSFCLPADNINHLKITHGSCRKPHGGTTDALRALDTMIEINSTDSSQRPQLLCLTGDQIYADDVSDILLHKIIKAQHRLLVWKETLPKSYSASQLLPGNRKDIIAKTGNKNTRLGFGSRNITADDLTTTDADNHLIFFGEFLLMYLFAFSDVLWSDSTPIFRPKHIDHKIKLDSFLKSLPYVRKALANISVLMVFDDHDITDDWFITKRWSEVALMKGTTSRRYIFNGMMAYAIFQDWGNDYLKYQSGDGLAILNALNLKDKNSYLSNVSAYPNKHAAAVESIVLPEVVRDNSNIADASWYLKSRIRWDYRVDYNSFILFVLNTRTERQYYDKEKQVPNLIKSIHTNGSFNAEKLAVVVSAAPVFANVPLEIRQDQFREGKTDLLTGLLARATDNIGWFERDQESWSFSGRGFGRLLFFLSFFKKVLILSGDVHHAFTAEVRLWRQSGSVAPHITRIVQSTSSALKNSTEGTHYPAINKYGLQPNPRTTYKRIKVLGRTKPGQSFEQFDNPRFDDPQDYNPDRTRIELESVKVDPSLQYNIRFVESLGYSVPPVLTNRINTSLQAVIFTNSKAIQPVPGVVIGKDNLSLISFSGNTSRNSIWLANGTRDKPDFGEAYRLIFPYVNHVIDLTSVTTLSELPIKEFDKIRERVNMD